MANSETKLQGSRKQARGMVVSRSGNKTIVVRVDSRRRHPKYEKVVRQSRKCHVHDEKNEAQVGDGVRISETRPLSRLKRWRLVEVIERSRRAQMKDADPAAEPDKDLAGLP